MIYNSFFDQEDISAVPPELWLNDLYGVKIYLDDNFEIKRYEITDEKKFLMFMLKWS